MEKKLKHIENGYEVATGSECHYSKNRNTLEDLSKSESWFLIKYLSAVETILDIGCACGGGYAFCSQQNKKIKYHGIDISDKFVALAKIKYGEKAIFARYDGYNVPFSNNTIDLVFCFGVLHHLLHWRKIIEQMYAISRKYIIFDLRLHPKDTIENPKDSYLRVAFDNKWDGETIMPYCIINIKEAKTFIRALISSDDSLEVYGYRHKPTPQAVTPTQDILMITICIEKESKKPRINLADLDQLWQK